MRAAALFVVAATARALAPNSTAYDDVAADASWPEVAIGCTLHADYAARVVSVTTARGEARPPRGDFAISFSRSRSRRRRRR